MDPTFFCPVCGEPALRADPTPNDFSCRTCDAAVHLRVFAAAGNVPVTLNFRGSR